MKQTPLKRKTPLERKSSLKQGAPLKRSSPLKRGATLAHSTLKRRARKRHDEKQVQVFFETVLWRLELGGTARRPAPCRMCGHVKPDMDPHHVLPKQWLAKVEKTLKLERGSLMWDPDNGIALCRECHDRHELAHKRIPRWKLPHRCWLFVAKVDALLGTQEATARMVVYPMDEA